MGRYIYETWRSVSWAEDQEAAPPLRRALRTLVCRFNYLANKPNLFRIQIDEMEAIKVIVETHGGTWNAAEARPRNAK